MPWTIAKLGRPRFRVRTLLALTAAIAVSLGIWREYWSPKWVWRRAIHENVDADAVFRYHGAPIGVWSSLPPQGLIAGLDREATIAEVERAALDSHVAVRIEALKSIDSLKLDRSRTLAMILDHPDDNDARVRATVAYLVGRHWMEEASSRVALLRLFEDKDPVVRLAVSQVVAGLSWGTHWKENLKIGIPDIEPLQAALVTKLGDPDLDVRAEAAFRLAEMGRDEEAMPVLLEYVRNRESWRRDVLNSCHPKSIFLKIAHKSDDALAFLISEIGPQRQEYPALLPRMVYWTAERGGQPARLRLEHLATAALKSADTRTRANAATLLYDMNIGTNIIPN